MGILLSLLCWKYVKLLDRPPGSPWPPFGRTVHALCNIHTLLTNGVLRLVELWQTSRVFHHWVCLSLCLDCIIFTSLNQGTAWTRCISFPSSVRPWVGGAASKWVWGGFCLCQVACTSYFQSTNQIYWLLEIIAVQRSIWSSRWWYEEFERNCSWLDNPKGPSPDPTSEP